MSSKNRPTESAARITDDLLGEPLTWITGAPGDRDAARPLGRFDHALGSVLSWIGLSRRAR